MLLKIKNLTKRFDGFTAVNNVSLSIQKGEIRALIGSNGAGKTTFFNLVSGLLSPDSGTIQLNNTDLTRIPTHDILQMGLARSFQKVNIFPKKTVFENVQVALIARAKLHFNFLKRAKYLFSDKVNELLDLVNLSKQSRMKGSDLAHGMQKQLELAITLAGDPEILLLDEPTAGMSLAETIDTIKLIKSISQKRGLTLLFTEHDMKVVFEIADQISVLHHGEIIASGSRSEVRANHDVRSVYLGSKEL